MKIKTSQPQVNKKFFGKIGLATAEFLDGRWNLIPDNKEIGLEEVLKEKWQIDGPVSVFDPFILEDNGRSMEICFEVCFYYEGRYFVGLAVAGVDHATRELSIPQLLMTGKRKNNIQTHSISYPFTFQFSGSKFILYEAVAGRTSSAVVKILPSKILPLHESLSNFPLTVTAGRYRLESVEWEVPSLYDSNLVFDPDSSQILLVGTGSDGHLHQFLSAEFGAEFNPLAIDRNLEPLLRRNAGRTLVIGNTMHRFVQDTRTRYGEAIYSIETNFNKCGLINRGEPKLVKVLPIEEGTGPRVSALPTWARSKYHHIEFLDLDNHNLSRFQVLVDGGEYLYSHDHGWIPS